MRLRDMSRRKFLRYSAYGLLGTGVLSGLYAWRIEPHWVSVVSLDLPVEALPPELDGATLVQISDLHVGNVVSTEYLEATVSRVAELKPDIVAVTGDWMSCSRGEQIDATLRLAEKIARGVVRREVARRTAGLREVPQRAGGSRVEWGLAASVQRGAAHSSLG